MTHVQDSPLRFAMIGAGGIGTTHVRCLAARPDLGTIVAVCDPRKESVSETLAYAPRARGFSSLSALLDAVVVDAAIIGTPHHMHAEQALTLVGRGIPVLVEKPVTCTTDEIRELQAESERTGAFVLPGQTRRFLREVQWLKAHTAADPDMIGDITSFALQSMQDVRAYTRGRDHWILDAKLAGGGVVISLAIHQLDLIRYLSDTDYASVMAFAQYDAPFRNGAESTMTATLKMSNGAIGTMQATYAATRMPFSESLNLIGRHGSIAQHAENLGDEVGPLTIASSHGTPPSQPSDQVAGWAGVASPHRLEHLGSNSFSNMHAHFVEVIRGTAEPIITLRDNFNTVACIEALAKSAVQGRRVQVETW